MPHPLSDRLASVQLALLRLGQVQDRLLRLRADLTEDLLRDQPALDRLDPQADHLQGLTDGPVAASLDLLLQVIHLPVEVPQTLGHGRDLALEVCQGRLRVVHGASPVGSRPAGGEVPGAAATASGALSDTAARTGFQLPQGTGQPAALPPMAGTTLSLAVIADRLRRMSAAEEAQATTAEAAHDWGAMERHGVEAVHLLAMATYCGYQERALDHGSRLADGGQ